MKPVSNTPSLNPRAPSAEHKKPSKPPRLRNRPLAKDHYPAPPPPQPYARARWASSEERWVEADHNAAMVLGAPVLRFGALMGSPGITTHAGKHTGSGQTEHIVQLPRLGVHVCAAEYLGFHGIKVHVPSHLLTKWGVDGTVLSLLYGQRAAYIVGSTEIMGSYGKLRRALRLADGALFVAKELRFLGAPQSKRSPKTCAVPMSEIIEEVIYTKRVAPELAVDAVISLEKKGKTFVLMAAKDGDQKSLNVLAKRLLTESDRKLLTRYFFVRLCERIAACHSQGIVHCDIKPANVLWDGEGGVHLCDFGLTECKGHEPLRGGAGTYEAPEMVYGDNTYDERVDIWALGLTLTDMHVPLSPSWFGHIAKISRDRYKPRHPIAVSAYKEYAQWHAHLATDGHEVNLDLLEVAATAVSNEYNGVTPTRDCEQIARASTTYFAKLRHADPDLCQVILQGMVHPDPTRRLPAEQLLHVARRLLPQNGEAKAKDLMKFLGEQNASSGDSPRERTNANLRRAREALIRNGWGWPALAPHTAQACAMPSRHDPTPAPPPVTSSHHKQPEQAFQSVASLMGCDPIVDVLIYQATLGVTEARRHATHEAHYQQATTLSLSAAQSYAACASMATTAKEQHLIHAQQCIQQAQRMMASTARPQSATPPTAAFPTPGNEPTFTKGP